MDTNQINRVLKKYKWTKKEFCGVMPIDYLPKNKVKRPCSYIINTDKSTLPGRHWFAIYLPKQGNIEYFDSFGIKPMNHEVYDFMKINGNKWSYNKIQIQDTGSSSCGKICALYICYRSKGLTQKDFVNLFSVNKKLNEKIIKHLFKKMYNF